MGSNKQTDDIVGNTFSKQERLYHKKIIEELFKNGSSTFLYPFLIKYLPSEDKDSPYVNLVVSREDNKNEEKVKQFLQAFQSPEVEKAAEVEFKGGAVKGW